MLEKLPGLHNSDGQISRSETERTTISLGKRSAMLPAIQFALFRTVFDNVMFPLEIARVPAKAAKERLISFGDGRLV